jgi:hypothetical protein
VCVNYLLRSADRNMTWQCILSSSTVPSSDVIEINFFTELCRKRHDIQALREIKNLGATDVSSLAAGVRCVTVYKFSISGWSSHATGGNKCSHNFRFLRFPNICHIFGYFDIFWNFQIHSPNYPIIIIIIIVITVFFTLCLFSCADCNWLLQFLS